VLEVFVVVELLLLLAAGLSDDDAVVVAAAAAGGAVSEAVSAILLDKKKLFVFCLQVYRRTMEGKDNSESSSGWDVVVFDMFASQIRLVTASVEPRPCVATRNCNVFLLRFRH
jgi:hypothetical protein